MISLSLESLNIRKAISHAKSGLPFRVLDKKNETSTKKVFLSEEAILPEFLTHSILFDNCITKHKYNFLYKENTNFNMKITSDGNHEKCQEFESAANQLCFHSSLLPSTLVCDASVFDHKMILDIQINDILTFNIKKHQDFRLASESKISLKYAENSHIYVFSSNITGEEHYAIFINNPLKDINPLIRIHSSCYTGDLLASLRCDCRDQLQDSIKYMSETNNFSGGIVIYLMQEGRGIGLANKIKAYKLQQEEGLDTVDSNTALGFREDERNFTPVKTILNYFNIKSINILTNNPKKATDIANLGINIAGIAHTKRFENPLNKEYLSAKEIKMGHQFT